MTDQCKHCAIRGDIKECRSETCHQHENWYATHQQKEIDQLKAQVEALRDFCEVIAAEEKPWSVGDLQFLLQHFSEQSLAEHNAALLEWAADKITPTDADNLDPPQRDGYLGAAHELRQEAQRIRQETVEND
jgi:hypothetical protein